MSNIKNAQQKPKSGLDLNALPDFSQNTPTMPAQAVPSTSPAPAQQGGLGSFMPGAPQTGIAQTGGGSQAVRKMQEAILHFADVASSSDVTSMKGNQTGVKQRGDEYLGGSDPFGDFLASRIGEKDNRAPENQQWVHTDLKQPQRSNTGMADSSLRGMVDDLRRVGNPGQENKADGVWKGRTDHALKNIRLIASELLHLSNDMGLSIPGLTEKAVDTLRASFPESYTQIKPGTMEGMAESLTGQINHFAQVFGYFKKLVLENPGYRKYIDQKKSFVQYQQKPLSGDSLLTPEENKIYATNVNAVVPNIQLGKTQITLVDLKSMENFKSLMQRAGIDTKDQAAVQEALNEVAKGLGVNPVQSAPQTPSQYDPGY